MKGKRRNRLVFIRRATDYASTSPLTNADTVYSEIHLSFCAQPRNHITAYAIYSDLLRTETWEIGPTRLTANAKHPRTTFPRVQEVGCRFAMPRLHPHVV